MIRLALFLVITLALSCSVWFSIPSAGFAFSQDIKDAQVLLNSLGFDAGQEDGINVLYRNQTLSQLKHQIHL